MPVDYDALLAEYMRELDMVLTCFRHGQPAPEPDTDEELVLRFEALEVAAALLWRVAVLGHEEHDPDECSRAPVNVAVTVLNMARSAWSTAFALAEAGIE